MNTKRLETLPTVFSMIAALGFVIYPLSQKAGSTSLYNISLTILFGGLVLAFLSGLISLAIAIRTGVHTKSYSLNVGLTIAAGLISALFLYTALTFKLPAF
jgi:hypothetical protein